MERSEPTLVPEWLKSSGSIIGGGTATHQFAHPDDHALSKTTRNRSALNLSDNDLGRERTTTSSYSRWSSSSNGSAQLRSYGSFGRNHRDRDWDKDIHSRDKEKSNLGDHRNHDYSDPLGRLLPSRYEKDGLSRSQSMVAGRRGEKWPRKFGAESSNANKNSQSNGSSLLAGGSTIGGVHKVAFDRDFPSLLAEERQVNPEIGRVPSPGLSTAIQNLPVGNLGVIGGDGWTSALAEVPVIVGSNGTSTTSVHPVLPVTSASVASNLNTGLNMAETLAQGPSRAPTNPQLTVETQRLEELAIKQSRQLIPVIPSLPKGLATNPPEKAKPKVGQHQLVNTSPRFGPVKSDVSKSSTVGKLHVLKSGREKNGVSPTAKDSLSPTSSSKVSDSAVATGSSVAGPAPLRGPGNNLVLAGTERKPALSILEKRPTPQTQSRNDFFNLMRKKSMVNSPSTVLDAAVGSPSDLDKPSELEPNTAPEDGDAPSLDSSDRVHSAENKGELALNSNASVQSKGLLDNGKNHFSPDTILYSEEEEAAFLRSLGWEENAGEDEGLTEEEINAFYRDVSKYINSRPFSKISQRMPPKFLVPLNMQMEGIGGVSSGLSSSDSKLES